MSRRRLLLWLAPLLVAGIALATMAVLGSDEEAPKSKRSAVVARADADSGRRVRSRRTARGVAGRLAAERLAGQMMLVGFEGTEPRARFFERLSGVDFGGVLLEARNVQSPEQFAALVGEVGVVARNAQHLPPLVVASGELLAQGQLPVPARSGARAAAAPLAAAGVHLVLGPVADVATAAGPGEETTYGDDPRKVRRLALVTARGFSDAGVGVAPLHFPGQGAAAQDPLSGPAVVGLPREQLLQRDVAPFAAVLREADAVVVSNAAYVAWDPVTPAAHTPAIVRDLLRRQLKFRGVAIADNVLGATSLTGAGAGEAAVAAVRAGCDLVHVRDEAEREEVYAALVAALRSGQLPVARAREAVARTLELKRRLGVLQPS